MKKLRDHLLVKPAAAALSILMLVFAWLPGLALADQPQELGLDTGHVSRRVGDPLDTNDAGGDGGSDDVQDTAGDKGAGRDIFGRILPAAHVLIVPQYVGGSLTFTIIIMTDAVRAAEGRHAK